jgi:hypothetical protein
MRPGRSAAHDVRSVASRPPTWSRAVGSCQVDGMALSGRRAAVPRDRAGQRPGAHRIAGQNRFINGYNTPRRAAGQQEAG